MKKVKSKSKKNFINRTLTKEDLIQMNINAVGVQIQILKFQKDLISNNYKW